MMEGNVWLPPYDAALDSTVHMWALIAFGALALGSFAFAAGKAWRDRDGLPLILFLGSLAMATIEPYVDAQGLCWYPEIGTIPGYRSIGRTIPLYIVLVFCFYVAPAMIVVVDRCRKGVMSAGWLLKFYLVTVLLATLFEPIPLHYGMWSYYGYQPFVILGFPVWFAFVNTACVLLTAVAAYKLLPWLPGWRRILLIPIVPVLGIGFWSACGFFASSTLNTFLGQPATSIGALATMLTCVGAIWLAGSMAAGEGRAPQPRSDGASRPSLA